MIDVGLPHKTWSFFPRKMLDLKVVLMIFTSGVLRIIVWGWGISPKRIAIS